MHLNTCAAALRTQGVRPHLVTVPYLEHSSPTSRSKSLSTSPGPICRHQQNHARMGCTKWLELRWELKVQTLALVLPCCKRPQWGPECNGWQHPCAAGDSLAARQTLPWQRKDDITLAAYQLCTAGNHAKGLCQHHALKQCRHCHTCHVCEQHDFCGRAVEGGCPLPLGRLLLRGCGARCTHNHARADIRFLHMGSSTLGM